MAHTCDICGGTAGHRVPVRRRDGGEKKEIVMCGKVSCLEAFLEKHPELEVVGEKDGG